VNRTVTAVLILLWDESPKCLSERKTAIKHDIHAGMFSSKILKHLLEPSKALFISPK